MDAEAAGLEGAAKRPSQGTSTRAVISSSPVASLNM